MMNQVGATTSVQRYAPVLTGSTYKPVAIGDMSKYVDNLLGISHDPAADGKTKDSPLATGDSAVSNSNGCCCHGGGVANHDKSAIIPPGTPGSENRTYKDFAEADDPSGGPAGKRDKVDEFGNVYTWDPDYGRYEACGLDDGHGYLNAYSDKEYERINKLDEQTPVDQASNEDKCCSGDDPKMSTVSKQENHGQASDGDCCGDARNASADSCSGTSATPDGASFIDPRNNSPEGKGQEENKPGDGGRRHHCQTNHHHADESDALANTADEMPPADSQACGNDPISPGTSGSEARTYKDFAEADDPLGGPAGKRDKVDEFGNVYTWDSDYGRYEACGKDDGNGDLIAYSDKEYVEINKLTQQTPVARNQ